MDNIHRTGCASLLTHEQVQARYHQSEGYVTTIKVPQPEGAEVRFVEITAIKEGVWNGILEPAEVLKRGAPSLLGKYIVLGHPDSDTSPSWPDEALGQVIDVSCDGEDGAVKVLAVLWVSRVPPDLLARLEAGEKVSVSVGFQMYSKEESGEWNGKPYSMIAERIYFEHIGIVPVGACTPDDGCSAQIIIQNEKSDGGNTDGEDESKTQIDVESKTVNQAVGAPTESVEPEVPPPLFKDPDELLLFTNEALAIQDNDELREEQLRVAFNFVRKTMDDYGYGISDIQDANTRASAMAAFVARAAESWRNDDPLFTPPGEEQVVTSVTQSQSSRSGRGDDNMTEKDDKGDKTLFHYPVLSQTEDGVTQITWNSTEDPKEAENAKVAYDTEFKKVLGGYDDTMKDLKAQADAGQVADGVARTLLLGNLKTAMPKLNDESLERYKGMSLDSLVGIVNDLGQNIAMASPAGDQAPSMVTQTPDQTQEGDKSTKVTQSPTPVNLQKMRAKNPMTFAEAQKRLQKELGMTI